jgi:hypothetical protein
MNTKMKYKVWVRDPEEVSQDEKQSFVLQAETER